MKVVHIAPYYPPHLGGMEVCVKQLAERMQGMGHDVTVLTSDVAGARGESGGPVVKRMRSIHISHTPIIPALLPELLAAEADVFHFHTAAAYVPEISWIASRLKGVPLVAHFHGDAEPSGPLGFLLSFYKRNILRRVLLSSNAVLCPSPENIAVVSKKYGVPKSKCVFIPSGVDTIEFKGARRIGRGEIELLFVGRIARQKNLPRLIRAFKKVLEKRDAILHVVGDGEERKSVEEMVRRMGLRLKVVFHGRVSRSALIELYKTKDIFVMSSDYEGSPLSMIEAMAAGMPMVLPNIAGTRDVARGCAVFTELDDSSLAAGLEKLIADEEMQKELGERGKRMARKHDWSAVARKVVGVYETVLKGRRCG